MRRRMRFDTQTLLCRSRNLRNHLEEEHTIITVSQYNYVLTCQYSALICSYLNSWTFFLRSLLFLSSLGLSTSCRIFFVFVIVWFLQPEQMLREVLPIYQTTIYIQLELIMNLFYTTSGLETGISFKADASPLASKLSHNSAGAFQSELGSTEPRPSEIK